MKTIALFGGTGFVGHRVKEKLLTAGFSICMLVRDREHAWVLAEPGRVQTVQGNIENADAVAATLNGCDACIVTTGARSNSLADMQAIVQGTQLIIDTMQRQKIKRLVKLSGVSVRVGDEPFGLMRRLLDIGLKIAMPNPSKSKYLEQAMIEASGLDWIVVRPPVVSREPLDKPFAAHAHQYLGLKVSLDDLSDFIIAQLDSDQWLHQCPTVGYG